MALEVGIAVLSTVVFAAVLSSFLNWLKDLIKNSEVLGLKKGMEESRPSVNRKTTSRSQDPLMQEMESKFQEVFERIEDLRKDSAVFGLTKAVGEKRSSEKRKTTSLVDESEGFYGRDADKETIIHMLISDDDNRSNPGVIPIVGMGGMGKTTLAQHVYNDKAVEEQFKIRAWVCVSDQFDETRVTKEILEKVTRKACHHNDLDQLQVELKKALNGEKFLLVLDDVWSEDYEKWRRLMTPLRSGAKGSKLIITTRSKKVASKVQTVPTHDLRELEYEDCWKLFATHACLDVNSTANPELQEIGKEIVRKCGGLPLAAKALGGVLRWETKTEKWKEVLKSEIWDVQNANILPSLAMSYIHLPPYLKRCFAYCAIFPQDYQFQKEELVALWMSEGFLVQRKGNLLLEEIGNNCFDDLVSRSFFQHSSNSWDKPYFVMHDLVYDLARFVSGEFCSRLEGGTSWKIGKKTRYLFCERTAEDILKKFPDIHETLFLRSFLLAPQSAFRCDHWNPETCIDKKVIDGLLPRRKLLRVLSLSCYEIRKLPNSIDNLKHLRHLDLSYTRITLLPEAVATLFNLEILILRECLELVVLPGDMARLTNLCQLDLSGTRKLKWMPPELGKLKKLSKLSDFVVGENGGSSIKELGNLHYLRGQIFIRRLENVKDDRDASEAILKDKENLKVLSLNWNGDANDPKQVKQVLEILQPHMDIECVLIMGYGGTDFPNWVGDISFSKLKRLGLHGCKNCICLPPLGQLASLEELIINDYAVLEAIGLEFYRMCKPGEKPFSSLKTLEIRGMLNWREWSSCTGAFPVLEELWLSACPKLMSVPCDLPSLKLLSVIDCCQLDFESLLISTCATLETIHIGRNEKVKCISIETFPNLKILDLEYCSNLESLVGSTAATRTRRTSDPLYCPSLTSLHIEGCFKLVSFPKGGLHAPNLKSMYLSVRNLKSLAQGTHSLLPSLEKLQFHDCPELLSVPSHLPSLKRIRIEHCGELDIENLLICTCATLETISRSEKAKGISVETFPNLEELDITHCSNLECLWSTTTRTRTRTSDPLFSPSLTSLHLKGCSKLVSFPRGGLHAPNLKRMDIDDCCNLKSLPQGMHSLLPSLEELRILDCPEIESFPDGGLPSKLQDLRIGKCEKLVGGRMQWGLQSLPCLSSMRIGGGSCEDVESSFPEETLLPSSLQSLEIWGFTKLKSLNYKGLQDLTSLQSLEIFYCWNLKSLPEEGLGSSLKSLKIWGVTKMKSLNCKGLQHLSSLQHLEIKDCKNLESLPEEGLPASLSYLLIDGCPLLEKRCKREIGEDWPKIKHIPRLYFN